MRYLKPYILNDLKKKMVFIGGPRQSGKTTLAKDILKEFKNDSLGGLYLNWDRSIDKKKTLSEDWSKEDRLLIFDEIHKYPKWKNLIKGYFDSFKDDHQFIVTGSARLDLYKKGGDSLLGRYHYWRLHPFDLSEIPGKISKEEAFKRLLNVGGFPEPFLDNDQREAKRWREERYNRIIRDDIRDLENIKNIQQMSMLLTLLRERVGGLIVVSNLAQDLQVSPMTVAKWIEIFEKMYLIFTVRTWTHKLPRAISKPFKVYFFDNADVIGDEGAKFENLVATHLIKKCHFHQDYTGEKMELWFLRDKEHHEADFMITNENKIIEIIETKWSDTAVSPSLLYFAEKLKSPSATQIVGELKKDSTKNNFKLRSAISYFTGPV